MWSITLIVVAAVASGFAMLCAGVTLAITFERHRHRKILRAHGIGINGSPIRHMVATVEVASGKRASVRKSLGLTTTESGGWAILESEPTLQLDNIETTEEATQPEPTETKRLNNLIWRLSKKGSQRPRKLKKNMPLYPSMNSPLSVITEITGSPRSHSSLVDVPMNDFMEQKDVEGSTIIPVPWPLAVVKTRNRPSTPTMDSDCESSQPARSNNSVLTPPKMTIRSVSMTSSVSNPPGDPLPPLPKIEIPTYDQAANDRNSVGSIETTDSSVLDHVSSLSIKPPSQALREFNFGLDAVTLRLASLARQTQEGFYDQRSAVTSYRASTNATEDVDKAASFSANRSLFELMELSSNRGGKTASGSSIRHSMFADCTNLDAASSCTFNSSRSHPDSFKSRIPVRSMSVNAPRESVRNSRPYSIAQCNKIERTSSQIKGHKRQNCVRISIPLIENKAQRQLKMPQVIEEPENDPVKPLRAAIRPASANNLLWPQPLSLQRTSTPTPSPTFDCDVFGCDNPLMPGENHDLPDFGEDMPSSNSSPSRGHLTPTLPSPAYSTARLFTRVSKVQGPRNNPYRSQYSKHKTSTPDLRRSVMMLRNITSGEKLLDKVHEGSSYNLDSVRNSVNSSSRWSSSARTRSPLSSRYSTPQKNMTCSQSTMSIWEDIPVQDDSPEPEVPTINHTSIRPASREIQMPKTSIADHEARENTVYESVTVRSNLNISPAKVIGLGLQLGNVPDTRRSLYDHEGFLRD